MDKVFQHGQAQRINIWYDHSSKNNHEGDLQGELKRVLSYFIHKSY